MISEPFLRAEPVVVRAGAAVVVAIFGPFLASHMTA